MHDATAKWFWGEIQWAVREKATTAQLYDVIKSSAAVQGIKLHAEPGSTIIADVSRLRGLAFKQMTASGVLGGAGLDQVITADMITRDINSRPDNILALAGEYKIRWKQTMNVDGQIVEKWHTSKRTSLDGVTVGDLLAELNSEGMQLVQQNKPGYEGEHLGVSDVSIRLV